MRLSRFALLAIAVVTLSAQEKPEIAAQKSAESWLALIDAGKYGESYDEAAVEFKAGVPRGQWVQKAGEARQGTGALKSRKLLSALYTESIPKAPPGRYVVLQFDAKFTAGSSTEQVVILNEKDGSWRSVGYVMSPPQ